MTEPVDLRRQWGAAVRARREELGWTQHQLALAADMQQGTISHVERGSVSPSDKYRVALARALRVEVADLFAYPSTTTEVAS